MGARLISLVLALTILLSVFSIFAFAEDSADTGVSPTELSVAYNRTFSEGWDYTNGIVADLAKGNTAGLAYEYRNSSYNYYLRLDKQNISPSYLYIDTEDKLATSGKTFIELDVTSGAGTSLGQAVRVSVQGDIKTLVEFRDDGMYILGANVGTAVYDLKWESVKFEFDFSYTSTETLNNSYKVKAYHNGSLVSEKVYEYGTYGAGITQLRFAFGDVRPESIGSWYGVDNVKVYSGVTGFTSIEADNYGLAVDDALPRDYELAGDVADPDGYLRGEPEVDRLESLGTAFIHYNRTFDEGWDLSNGGTVVDNGNNVDIRSEKLLSGGYNHFFRFRALNKSNGYLKVPVVNYPTSQALYFEFDIKAGVNADLGGIVRAVSATGDVYALSIVDGQLHLFDRPVGFIGSDWLHIIMVFETERGDGGLYNCTVYYGKGGVMEATHKAGVINELRFGAAAGGSDDKFGDWFGLDNVQIYSGTEQLVTLPADEYGVGVDATAPKDFPLEDTTTPETPLEPDAGEDEGGSGNDFVEDLDPDRLLSGAPDLDRITIPAENPYNVWIRYNRNYSEGWNFFVGGANRNAGSIFQLEAEQSIDLTYNYYQHYEQNSIGNSYWELSPGTGAPTSGKVFIEFDIRAVEGIETGAAIQMRTNSDGKNPDIIAFEDGKLVTYASGSKQTLGILPEDEWVHIAFEFDYDYGINNPDKGCEPGHYLVRMWVGDSTYYETVRKAGGKHGISALRIGVNGTDAVNHGQFWHMDNFQWYSGASFATIDPSICGTAIDPNAPKDFPIQNSAVSLDNMIEESLYMKIGSEYGLVNYERAANLTDANGVAYGCPTLIDDVVWVPLDTVLNFLSYPIYIHEDGVSFDISTGSKIAYITLGRNTAVIGGVKVDLTAAPAMVTDKLGYEFLAVTLDDLAILFPEFLVGRDDMNMLTFTKYETVADGSMSESQRMELMKLFLFDYLTPDEFYERTLEHTNGFDHPYLITNQERFDELREAWLAGFAAKDDDPTNDVEYDVTLYAYINSIVDDALGYYNKYSGSATSIAVLDGGIYEGLNPLCYIYDSEVNSLGLRHPYKSSSGYDPIGGRLNPPFNGPSQLAYAWQVTGDIRFAQMAYDYIECLVDWDHWGPGHFLNAADTASVVAVCYDWCYDVWVELGLDVDKIADGIFYHGALQGYLVSTGQPDPHGRAQGDGGSPYSKKINNWNAVCTSGVAAAAFAVMGYTGYSTDTKLAQPKAALRAEVYGGEEVRMVCSTVLSMNFKTLIDNGLEIYAPDGSYEESAAYWAYGANSLFRYCSLLESATGGDLGLMDCWGLDRTCYSNMHMVSSDYRIFAYNDCSVGSSCDSSWFNYVAHAIGDNFLHLVRNIHINEGGRFISYVDSIFYVPVEITEDVDIPLQYHHVGIHGYTLRSSWERGAIFAGILGGNNNDGHGHIDAGQWIYYADGIPFIEDIGSDDYNTYNYFNNNHMYKTTVEGHNCILVSSAQDKLPAGQERHSVSPVTKTGDNEHGAYVVIDTLPAFAPGNCLLRADRGMLFTNDRKTVIVQDEIIPNGSQTVWWIAHYSTDEITNVEIANNGRTVYMTSRKSSVTDAPVVLRMNMVSPTPGIVFEKSTSYDFLLDATMRPGDSEAMGAQPENDRSNWLKLLVKFENLMSIDFAVALEVIDPADPVLTGYKFTTMDEWEPYADTRVKAEVDEGEIVEEPDKRDGAKPSDLLGFTARIDTMVADGIHFEQIAEFYSAITQITYTVDQLGRNYFEGKDMFTESLELYDSFYLLYTSYYNDVKITTDSIFAITDVLTGAKKKAAATE